MDQTSHTTQSHLKNTCNVCKGLGYIIEHKIDPAVCWRPPSCCAACGTGRT